MAFLQKKTRKSLAVRNRKKLKLNISPDLQIDESMAGFLGQGKKRNKKSSNSHYVSNSRSGLYAMDNNTDSHVINP